MANYKAPNKSNKYYQHLNYDDRSNLQKIITQDRYNLSLKSIANILGKDPSTISKVKK